jgi:hypothetical protein
MKDIWADGQIDRRQTEDRQKTDIRQTEDRQKTDRRQTEGRQKTDRRQTDRQKKRWTSKQAFSQFNQ